MNSEDQFWITVWKVVGAVAVVLIVSGMASCQATKSKILSAVEAGASPMEARCALDSMNTDATKCLLSGMSAGNSAR